MSTRYRVWCVSWGDIEEHGRDVYIARPERAAEEYAEYCHRHRDGWEDEWPLTFRVRSPDGSTADFVVAREMEPHFRAREP